VTPVASSIRSVWAAIAPRIDQAKPECSWLNSHGWSWSLISTKSKPASSARTAWATRSLGENASANSLYPIFTGSSSLAPVPGALPPEGRRQPPTGA
jgi:hypothetical protein